MSERLTRQEMKRDEVQEWMARAYSWVLDHARALVLASVAVVVAAFAGVLVFLYLDHRSGVAQEALAAALKVYQAPVDPTGLTPDTPAAPIFADEESRRARAKELFEEVVGDYGSTAAGAVASVYLGRIAVADGDAARARELWTRFVDDEPAHAMAATVQVALFSLDRQEGKLEELIANLRRAVEEASGPVPTDALLHELAVTLDAQGEGEESLAAYQRLVDEFPTSPYAFEARQRLVHSGGGSPSPFQLGT